jgi:alanine racemase
VTARLRVDIGRILDNIAVLRRRIEPAELMLIVKDDAYGHGLEQVVTAAAAHGVRWFGAFDLSAGSRARAAAGADARVFSWSAVDPDDIAAAIEGRIELGVGDPQHLEAVAAVAAGSPAIVHLKVDSGLHRNGVRPEDWPSFVARAAELEASGALVVAGIWSHIAEASDEEDDASRAVFEQAVADAQGAGLRPEVRHLAASAAAHARPEFRQDVVRIGAFAYGIRSAEGPALDGIEPAATLLAPVIRVGRDDVGIGIGALDGLPSSLGGRVTVGTPAGARSLQSVDLVESTVSAWPGAAVGDEVAVFGPGSLGESSATSLAESIGTVGEEILVRVSPRLPREYVGI